MELVELNRYSLGGYVKANFVCENSEDGHISILSENDVKILSFRPNMDSDENKLKFYEFVLKCGDFHVAEYTGLVLSNVYNLPRFDLYKMISNEIFTPKFEQTTIQLPKPISLSWSPRGVYKKDFCALATVSNTGNVEIFVKTCYDWICLVNITKILIEIEQKVWYKNMEEEDEEDEYIEDLTKKQCHQHMERVLNCAASCVSWSLIYESNNTIYTYLAVGYLDGTIRIWKLNIFDTKDDFVKPKLVATKKFMDDPITVTHWCGMTENTAMLVCGGLNGIIKAIRLEIKDDNVLIGEEFIIWEHADIRCFKIESLILTTHTFLLIVKNQHIVISLIDNESRTLVKTAFVDAGNFSITGLAKVDSDNFLILTLTGALKTLKIDSSNLSDVKFELSLAKSDIDWKPFVAKGLIKSPEGHLWGIVTFPSKIFDHLTILKPTEIFWCIKSDCDPGKMLKENNDQRLYKHWELLEIIRCLSIKKLTLPLNWVINCEIFDDISLYELRIMYWLTFASTKLMCYQKSGKDLCDEIADPGLLEKIIYFKYFIERLKILLNKLKNDQQLTPHQLTSLYFMKQSVTLKCNDECLKEYFNEKFLIVTNSLINNIDMICEVPVPDCIICDTPLTTEKCDHPDDRCIISNVQIMCNGKWHCEYCRGMAHEDIEETNPFCTICDVPMLPFDPEIE